MEVLLTETVLQWRQTEAPRPAMDPGAEPTDADPPPATGDDAHTRGGGGFRSFRQDADLEVCLDKCTIYMPGIPIERAQTPPPL